MRSLSRSASQDPPSWKTRTFEEWERAVTCAAEWHMLSAAKAQVVVGGGAAEQGGVMCGTDDARVTLLLDFKP